METMKINMHSKIQLIGNAKSPNKGKRTTSLNAPFSIASGIITNQINIAFLYINFIFPKTTNMQNFSTSLCL